jgi:hypothetical protein
MIRSSACQPWQPDLPGHAGDRGDLLSYTTPRDTIIRTRLDRLETIGAEIRKIECEIVAWYRDDDISRGLMTISGGDHRERQ